MLFHITVHVHDSIVLHDDKPLRAVLGGQFKKVLESGRVTAGGFLGGQRGAYLVVDIAEAADLYALLGPEIYSTCRVSAHPIITWEEGARLFGEWAAADR